MKFPSLPAQATTWSLLDQALVSGTNFLIGILLARQLGLAGFGTYVIAQTYLLYASTFHGALVVAPMMTAVPAEPDAGARHRMLRGFFAYMTVILLVTLGGVQAMAWLLAHWSSALGLGGLALPLAGAMIGFQLQDWLRRALYVEQAGRAVFLSDLMAYGMQFCGLAYLALHDAISPDRALWVMAASFGLSGACTAAALRLTPDLRSARSVIDTHWRASRDYLATWQLQWLASYGVILIGTGFVGTQAAGAIRAAQNVLGPVNVFFQWMDNVMPVRAATRLRDSGRVALATYLRRTNWVGVILLGSFTLLLLPIDGWLMATLYGEAYRAFAVLVELQALYYLFGHAIRMQFYYNRALEQTWVLARAALCWAIAGVACAFASVGLLAERGIMLSLVVGEAAALAYLLWVRHSQAFLSPQAESGHMAWNHGGTRLLLPLANRHVLRGALSLYVPSRWAGKLYRALLSSTLPLWARSGLAPILAGPNAWCVHLPRVLQAMPGARSEWVGGLQGKAGQSMKLTLRLMDERGGALAYARVAMEPVAAKSVQHEVEVLTRLAGTTVANHVPQLLDHGPMSQFGGYFLLESAGPEQRGDDQPQAPHFEFLRSLVTSKPAVPWAQCLQRDADQLAPALALFPDARDVFDGLSARDGLALPVCIEHGDFAPWNIRRLPDGQLFVLDWEHARLDGLPWLDALHFRFQRDSLVRRMPAPALLTSLRETFSLPCAQAYAAVLPVVSATAYPLMALYLLRMLAQGCRDGRNADAFQKPVGLQVLVQLRNERSDAS